MVFYLSGRMTGVPEYNFPAFHAAAAVLRERGFDVLNPAETAGGSAGLSYAQYMNIDVAYVQAADAVVVLPGWRGSKGALLEVHLAHSLGKPVFEFDEERGVGTRLEIERFQVWTYPVEQPERTWPVTG